jgi:hypothetical protein
MQPAANPDDIHAILSRFQTWAEQQPANGNGNGHKNGASPLEGVREIPYEEAIRQHRNRRAAQGQRRTAPPRTSASPVPPREPDVQAEPEPVAEVPSPSAVERTVAKIAEVAATSKFEPASPLSNDSPPAETENPAPIPAAATGGVIAGALLEPLKPLPRPILRSASKVRRPRPATIAAAPIPAPTMPTRAAVRARPPAKPAVRSAPNTAAKAAAQNAALRKSAAPLAAKPPIAKQPQFRQVLTKTVLQAERPAAPKPTPKKEATPDRTQRITTRFSPAEQRRIEKQAAESGLTVSAWLRHCALSNGAMPVHPKKPQAAPAKSGSRRRSVAAPNPAHVALFSQPTNSALGNWLTLLRQRFLSSPARFSEQA